MSRREASSSSGTFPGTGQFGVLSVHHDDGDRITVDLAGHDWTGRTLVAESFVIEVPPAAQ